MIQQTAEEFPMTAIPVEMPRNTPSETMSLEAEPRDAALQPMHATSATVIARDGRDVRIVRDGVAHAARVAFGCLIQPETGDRVLTSIADGTTWVLSVLDRRSDAPPNLWAEGDLNLISAGGDISLLAAGTVHISAATQAHFAAPEIDLHASVARFVLDELTQVGRRANFYVAKLRSMGEAVETFAEHVLTRAKRSSRFIEESDQMRAGDIDHRADGTLQLQAEVAFVTADTVVRIDADQIHMG
jgi:hypothetical protein